MWVTSYNCKFFQKYDKLWSILSRGHQKFNHKPLIFEEWQCWLLSLEINKKYENYLLKLTILFCFQFHGKNNKLLKFYTFWFDASTKTTQSLNGFKQWRSKSFIFRKFHVLTSTITILICQCLLYLGFKPKSRNYLLKKWAYS